MTQFNIQIRPIFQIGWSSTLPYLDIRSLTPAAPQVPPMVGILFGWRLNGQGDTKVGGFRGI